MPMTIDEAIEALTEIKKEIGGDKLVETSQDSGYLRDIETLYPPERKDPFYCGPCIGSRLNPPPDAVFATRELATEHEAKVHDGQRTCWQEDMGPSEEPSAGLILGDYASDAEEAYERRMER